MKSEEERLIEKLKLIESLFARPGSEGEKVAAELARDRIKARLEQFEKVEPTVEYRFTLNDQWSRKLMLALMRRYGIKPFRRHGQRRTTVMARVTVRFVNETLWPEFRELQTTLSDYFDKFTERVIAQAVHADMAEAEERPEVAGGTLMDND